MANNNTDKSSGSRRSILIMLTGGVFLFFAIYYIVLRDFNLQSRKEITSRFRNVSSCIDALRDRSADIAWWVASRPDIVTAIEKNDIIPLQNACNEILPKARISVIAITDTNGNVIAQRNTAGITENMAELLITRHALGGKPAAGIEEDHVLEMKMRAACPVINSEHRVIGVVVTGVNLFSDHTFVDGIIKNFGLVCSVFHNDVRVSTTIYTEGKRALGTKLNNPKIQTAVLEKGGTYEGRNKAVNKEYDTAYWPLKNVNGKIIGLIGIGKDRETITRIFTITAIVVLLITGFIGIVITRKSFRLQSLILLIIVPAMILITGAAGWLLYCNLYDIILDGFNKKLSALSTTTASCLDGDKLRTLLDKRDSENPDFVKYMQILRDIQKQKDVTYLYTFIMGGKKDIVYIIDASLGENYCPVGYEENLPMQNIDGLRRVVSDGTPYISEIQEYERYGLLKVGAAPIYGSSTNVLALAGVDINISVIKNKLRMAISHIIAVGALALMLAGLISFWFSKKLTDPLSLVKSGALLLAAGEYNHRITVSEPRELAALASAFNRVGNTIGGILQKAAENNEKTETVRRRSELAKDLADISTDDTTNKTVPLMLCWLGGHHNCANSSGAVAHEHLMLAWIADSPADTLQAVKIRGDIAIIGRNLLSKYAQDQVFVTATLRSVINDTVSAFILFNNNTGIITPITRRPVPAILIDSAGNSKKLSIADGKEITIQPGFVILLPSQIPAEILSGLAEQKRISTSTTNLISITTNIESVIRNSGSGTGAPMNGLLVAFERRSLT